MSTIDCGDRGPNFVDGCEIFNGGLGVGSKGAVRELVVTGCRIYDQVNGIAITGERSSGPGAGKTDRGHYLIWQNHISDCAKGVWISSGTTHGDRIWGNLIERCGTGFNMRDVGAVPDRPHLANNVFRSNDAAVYLVAGRDGTEKISTFVRAGFLSHNNLFAANKADWQSPLTWGRNLDLTLAQVQTFQGCQLEQGSLAAEPSLDQSGRSQTGCPALGKGAELALPDYLEKPTGWHIGLGPWSERTAGPEPGLTLSIAGSPAPVGPAERVDLRAVLQNEFSDRPIDLGGRRDLILTFHFGYRAGHRDKQELWRCRVELPARKLEPGQTLDLTLLPGWTVPRLRERSLAQHLVTLNAGARKHCLALAPARKLVQDLGRREQLIDGHPFVRRVRLLDRAWAEHHRGNPPARKCGSIGPVGHADAAARATVPANRAAQTVGEIPAQFVGQAAGDQVRRFLFHQRVAGHGLGHERLDVLQRRLWIFGR